MDKENSKKSVNPDKQHKILTLIITIIIFGVIYGLYANMFNVNLLTVPSNNTSQPSEPISTTKTKNISLMDFYDQVQNGMTQAEIEALSGGVKPSTTSETKMTADDTLTTCIYSGFFDKGMVAISYLNGTVNTKSKYNVD